MSCNINHTGLAIFKSLLLQGMLIERIEDYVSILFLPLYFAYSGLQTQLTSINSGTAVGILALVLGTACLGKILGTVFVAKLVGMDTRKSFALGFLMNTKGLVELIVLNIGLQKGVINQQLFAILVVMAIVTTFMTTPFVMWLHPPARDASPYTRRKLGDAKDESGELRLLACAHGTRNLPAMVHLTEILRGKSRKSLRVFVLHLMEFSERSSAIRIASMARREGRPHWREGESELDTVEVTFHTYGQSSGVKVKTTIAISGYENMHDDICSTAAMNRTNFIVLPYHKYYRHDGSVEVAHSGFQHVNSMVLRHSPCSVGILVDRGFGGPSAIPVNASQHICVLFFGGPDDREALMLARRMSQHIGVKLTIIQCLVRNKEPHARHGIHRVTSDAFWKHLPRKSEKRRAAFLHLLARMRHSVSSFFKAPYRTNNTAVHGSGPEEAEAPQVLGINGHTNRVLDPESQIADPNINNTEPTGHRQAGEIQLKMDQLEIENEKKLDMEALAPVRVSGKVESIDSMESADHQDTSGTNRASRNVRLKVWEMDDPVTALTDVSRFAGYGLVVVGLHLNDKSPLLHVTSLSGHGLGPIGSLFLSQELHQLPASVLVVQQQHPSQGQTAFLDIADERLDAMPSEDEDEAIDQSGELVSEH